jgi:hypothetical protein
LLRIDSAYRTLRSLTPGWRVTIVAAVTAVVAAACTAGTEASQPTPNEADTSTTATATEPPVLNTVLSTDWTTCEQVSLTGESRVSQVGLVEASGLVASSQFTDVLWSHNDSGSAAGIYGVGLDGSDHGFFPLADRDGVDIEDIAMVDGRIHLGDIGDNDRRRESVQVHIFDEPAPGSGKAITDITTIDLTYPDRATDAEALLVDPLSDEVVILSKDLQDGLANTRIYSFAMPSGTPTESIEMTFAGEIDVAALESQATEFTLTAVLFPGLLTAADISADGRLIAVRTYGTVWLYPRTPDQTMAEALQGQPCEGGSAAENQGESLAILPAGSGPDSDADGDPDGGGDTGDGHTVRYVTVTEGNTPVINVVTVNLR